MIIDLTVRNYGPFRDSVTFSLIASALKDDDEAVHESPSIRNGLLKSAVVFGPNASGKTYLLEAMDYLRYVVESARPEGLEIPGYIPFRLSKDAQGSPTGIRIRLLIDKVVYDYSIEYTSDRIVSESLYHSPNGRRTLVFSRGGADQHVDESMMGKVTSVTSYLCVAASFNDAVCGIVYNGIMDIRFVPRMYFQDIETAYRLCRNDHEIKEMMLSALDAADFGITDFEGEEHAVKYVRSDKDGREFVRRFTDISVIHDFEEADVDDDEKRFPMKIESQGTIEMFSLMGPVSDALKNGRTLIIDDFGTDLHPLLTRWIFGLFNAPENNNGAQLIVNTHDLGLMDIRDLFRRDQIWFTRKDRRNGSCSLYCLSDITGVKKGSDIRRDYLMGRFDAIPKVVGVRRL